MRSLALVLSLAVLSCEGSTSCPDGACGGGAASGGGTASGGGSGGGEVGGGAGGGVSTGGGSGGGVGDAGMSGDAGVAGSLSAQYPGDVGLDGDPRVLFHTGFENGMAGWSRYTTDTQRQAVLDDAAQANGGTHYLQQRVTRTMLAAQQYISTNAQLDLPTRVPELYWRFYARVVGSSAKPHHWVRVAAGTPSFQSDGLANTVPPGDQGFWFDVDLTTGDTLKLYVYWYLMRSGRCNDGSATPGCAGDQGSTYYYGNNFDYADQPPLTRDQWVCLEIRAKANTLGTTDGELTLWKDDVLIADYRPGNPRGRWLRDNFYSWGQYFQDVQAFEGFDLRSSADVLLKRVTLDAYYERGTLPASAPEEQVIHYDDVVVATARIGCRVP